FGPVVSPANQQLLRDFASGEALPALVELAVNTVDQERQALRNTYKTLRRERTQIEENPAQYDEPEKQIAELNQELALINQTIGILQDKYILNFFTDAGLLPNYAFPETGVGL